MPKPTFENLPEDKRARIVEHALAEFSAHPYEQASLSKVAERAGIAKGSLYQYFENKLDLYTWLLGQGGARKWRYMQTAPLPEPGAFFAWFEAILRGGLAFIRAEPEWAKCGESLMHAADPELRRFYEDNRRRGIAAFVDMLGKAQAAGELRGDLNLQVAATVLVGTSTTLFDLIVDRAGTTHERLAEDGLVQALSDDDLDDLARGLADVLRLGMAPDPAAQRSAP